METQEQGTGNKEQGPLHPSTIAVAEEWSARGPSVVAVAGQLIADTAARLRPGGLASRSAALTPGPSPRGRGEKAFLIVAGPGRSGTSAVARVLHESGVCMGRQFAAATHINPDGFYEEEAVVWLNERLLRDPGIGDRWHPDHWPWRSAVLAAAHRYEDEMRALVAGAADGWKDPRFSVTLEAWLPLLPTRPKVIVCLRSPEAFIGSVVQIYGLVSRRSVELQWTRHYRRLLDIIRDYRLEATCVEYDALVERPEETVAALAEFVGHPLRAEYIDPPLRRHVRHIPRRYHALYREVLALAPEGPRFEPPALAPRTASDAARIEAGELVQQLEGIVARVREAKASWEAQAAMPSPRFDEAMLAAGDAYLAMLDGVQKELAEIVPPDGLERYYDLAVRQVNLEKMIAAYAVLGARTPPDLKARKAAVRAWRRFGAPAAARRAERERRRERERGASAGS